MNQIDKLKAVVKKGIELRKAQKKYFNTRDRQDLGRSKSLEREFDRMAEDAMKDPDLFDQATEVG